MIISKKHTVDPQTRQTANHDLAIGMFLVVLASFLFYTTFSIPVDSADGGVDSRSFPQVISALMGVLGLILSAQGFYRYTPVGDKSSFNGLIFRRKVLPLVAICFSYLWLFILFGYGTSTLITLYITSYYFGVYGKKLLILPPILTGIFFYLFFVLMGVFEPPAQLFNPLTYFKIYLMV